jgi:signal transduction histidine kinase
MMRAERNLLAERREISSNLFLTTLGILIGMFALAILLFWVHFRLLEGELAQRERMEINARRLSGRILQLQDEERRKFSRELHDSLGQILSVAKMHLAELLEKNPQDNLLAQINTLLDQSITETRTISHLLHPPLLDEVGLHSALQWYLEGFSKRSGIETSMSLQPAEFPRLAAEVETAVFRIVQEALTNVFRHSGAGKASLNIEKNESEIVVLVRDNGKGISDDIAEFRPGSIGIGMAGMRQRVKEFGGDLKIRNIRPGTALDVVIPIRTVAVQNQPVPATAPVTAPATTG